MKIVKLDIKFPIWYTSYIIFWSSQFDYASSRVKFETVFLFYQRQSLYLQQLLLYKWIILICH